MSDEAEFDAFLKGEDALSRRMQAMPQAGPGAALDAAILQRAKDLMAHEARPEAANDAGASTPAPRRAGLGWRWRVPAGIAATVLAGVLARQAFQASVDVESRAGMPADESAVVMPEPVAEPAPKAGPVPAPVVSAPAKAAAPAPMMHDRVAQDKAAPQQQVQVTGKTMRPETPVRSAAAATVIEEVAAPPPAAAPAPAPAAEPEQMHLRAERSDERALERVEIAGSSVKRAAVAKAPAEWLASIEAMLGEEKNAQALDEWRGFRKTYPDYPVPQTTEERIKALQK